MSGISYYQLCPKGFSGDYSENDINSVYFETMFDNNLAYINADEHLTGCLGDPALVLGLRQDIMGKKECLCEGFLIDTMKDFLDVHSKRCEYRIESCTSFNKYKDSDVNNPLAEKLQSIQEKAEEIGDIDMITCYSALNSLVYDIISNDNPGERETKYKERFPEFCCVDFTPIGTLFKNGGTTRRLSDQAIQITGLCSEFDSGGDCIPGTLTQRLEDNYSICIINFAISILKSAFRPLDDILIKITRDDAMPPNTFQLNIGKVIGGVTHPFVIKTGAQGYFTVEKLTSAINQTDATATALSSSNYWDLVALIHELISIFINLSLPNLGLPDARKKVLCLLMCIKTAGDFIKIFTVYFLNKVNLLPNPAAAGTQYNTTDNIFFLTHDKSAMNLALCLNIHCFGGTGSASNYNPSGTSIRFFYWNSLPKWYKTNLKQKLIGLGYKFFFNTIPQTAVIPLVADIISQEDAIDHQDEPCPSHPDGHQTFHGGGKSATATAKAKATAKATATAKVDADADADAEAKAKSIAKAIAKEAAIEKKKHKAYIDAMKVAKSHYDPNIGKPTFYTRDEKGKMSWQPQTLEQLNSFKKHYRNEVGHQLEKGKISPDTYNKMNQHLTHIDLQKLTKTIIGDSRFRHKRIGLRNAYAKLNAAIITQLFTYTRGSNLIDGAAEAIRQFGNERPQTLPSFLEYSMDVSLMQRFISIVAIDTGHQTSIQFDIIYNGFMVIQSIDVAIEKDTLKSSIILNFRDFSNGEGTENIGAAELRKFFIQTIGNNINIGNLVITPFQKFALATITKEFINSIIVETKIHCLAFAHARRLIYFIEDKIKIPLIARDDLDLMFNATQSKIRANTAGNYVDSYYLKDGLLKLGRLVNKKHPCGPEVRGSLQTLLPPIIKNLEINSRIYSELYKKYKDVITYIDKLIELYNIYSGNYASYFATADELQLKKCCSILILLCESLLILVKFLCKLQDKLNDINVAINNNVIKSKLGEEILIECTTDDGKPKADILIAKTKKLYTEFLRNHHSCIEFIYETQKKNRTIRCVSAPTNIINKGVTGISCVDADSLLAVLVSEFTLLRNTGDGSFYASTMQRGFLPPNLGRLSRQPSETHYFGFGGQFTGEKYKNNEPKANNAKVPKVKEENPKAAKANNVKVPKVKEENPKAAKANNVKVPKVKEENPKAAKANNAKVPKVKEENPKAAKANNAKVPKVKEENPKAAKANNVKASNVKKILRFNLF